ncbi:MAG: oligopeptide transport system permease protein [Verrucomicrobiales bacterium]|jgi:oligopeptide transport system permease protein
MATESKSVQVPALEEVEEGSSLGRDAWLRLRQNKLAMICLWVFIGIVLLCIFGPFIATDPDKINLDARSQGPSGTYWFGSEHLGRDIFSRILHGGRISLAVGFIATVVSMTIGVAYGTIAGYVGGRLDTAMMRVVDVLYSLPFTIIVIILATFFGKWFEGAELLLLFIAIGMVEWLTMARITRGQILNLKKQEFVEAAVSLGFSHRRIMFRHLVPNVLGPIIVYTTLTVPAVMRLEAVLSFLGLGVKPPNSSWGTLIKEGADRMSSDPCLLIFPALFFSATLFCLNFLGDGLRDALDPKSSKD